MKGSSGAAGRLRAPVIVLLLLAEWTPIGCVPAPDVEPMMCAKPTPAQPDLGIGNKETGFIPIADGEPIHILLGPQGLHMIIVSVRLKGFERPIVGGSRSSVEVAIRHKGMQVGGTVGKLQPSRIHGDEVEFLGLRPTFTNEVRPLDGELADVAVGVRDGCDREIRISRTLRLTLEAVN